MTRRRSLAVRLAALAVAPLTLVALAPPAAAEPGEAPAWRGPARVRSQFPLDLPFLDLTPDGALLDRPGGGSLEILVTHSNTFEITPFYDQRVADFEAGAFAPDWDFNVDGEVTRISVRADFAVSRRVQLGFELPALVHSSGFLDSLIDTTHDAFGLSTNDRDDKPQDRLHHDLISGDRRLFFDDAETAFGDVVLRAKLLVAEGPGAAFSVVVEGELPTGDEDVLAGSDGTDLGVSLLVSAGRERHAFHGGLGHFVYDQPRSWPVEVEDRTSLFAGYEWRASDVWSFVTHLAVATSLLPDAPDRRNDDPRAEVVVGAHRGGQDWQVSFGLIENLTTADNTPDLGFFVGGRWWW